MSSRNVLMCFLLAGTAVCIGILASERNPTHSCVAIAHALPSMKGDHLRATLVEVTYPPEAASAAHTHACPVIGYVLNGAIRFQVNSDPEIVFHAGESFYEAPGALHRIFWRGQRQSRRRSWESLSSRELGYG
jgi:mannose-6-phosphate isomerase-like protein (cupin superfamily)